MYKGRRVFRAGPGVVLMFVGITALFAAGWFMTFRERGWNWVSVGLACATVVLGGGSIIESLVLRIELAEEAIIVTGLTGRRRFALADIEAVAEAKGVPPALRLKSGEWVKLPSVGGNVGNSIRAWLKQR